MLFTVRCLTVQKHICPSSHTNNYFWDPGRIFFHDRPPTSKYTSLTMITSSIPKLHAYLSLTYIYRFYFIIFLTMNPNPRCQISLWEKTGAPGENPRLSAECWRTLPTWGQMFDTRARTFDLRGGRMSFEPPKPGFGGLFSTTLTFTSIFILISVKMV